MPESHLNFRGLGTGKPKKVRRTVAPRSDVRSGGRDYGGGGAGRRVSGYGTSQSAQTSGRRYAQIQRQDRRQYVLTGHPEKFVRGDLGKGQVVDRRGTGKAQATRAGARARALLANYLSHTAVGHGLEAAHAAVIYDKLAPLFGPGAKMPDYYIGGTEGHKTRGGNPVGGFAKGHEIHLSEDEAKDLLPLIAPFHGALGTNIVAHETAHTQQSKRTPSVIKEGGADAFAEAAAAILGKPKLRMRGEYGGYDRVFNKATGKYKLLAALQYQFPRASKAYGSK